MRMAGDGPLEQPEGKEVQPVRRPRFSRSSDPPMLVLTPRDEQVVFDCWRYRWLTRQHLQLLTGTPGIRRLNDRLRRLYDHGYVERLRVGTVGAGLQPLYLVGPVGASLVAVEFELAEAVVRERVRENLRASAMLLPHDLSVNDVMIALHSAFQRDPDIDPLLWLNSRDCYDAYAPGRSLRPDAYFQVLEGGRRVHSCFLEVDRGTVGLEKWREKVKRYQEYRDGGFYTHRYGEGLTRFRVLTLSTTAARLDSLKEATRRIADRGFWFGQTGSLVQDADPRRAFWWKVDGTEAASLV